MNTLNPDEPFVVVWYAIFVDGKVQILNRLAYTKAQKFMRPMPFISRMREGTLEEGTFAEMDYHQIHKVSNFINGE